MFTLTFRDHHLHPAEIVLPHLSSNLTVTFIIFVTANLFVGLGRTDYHMPPPIHTELPATHLQEYPTKQYRHIPSLLPTCKHCQTCLLEELE